MCVPPRASQISERSLRIPRKKERAKVQLRIMDRLRISYIPSGRCECPAHVSLHAEAFLTLEGRLYANPLIARAAEQRLHRTGKRVALGRVMREPERIDSFEPGAKLSGAVSVLGEMDLRKLGGTSSRFIITCIICGDRAR